VAPSWRPPTRDVARRFACFAWSHPDVGVTERPKCSNRPGDPRAHGGAQPLRSVRMFHVKHCRRRQAIAWPMGATLETRLFHVKHLDRFPSRQGPIGLTRIVSRETFWTGWGLARQADDRCLRPSDDERSGRDLRPSVSRETFEGPGRRGRGRAKPGEGSWRRRSCFRLGSGRSEMFHVKQIGPEGASSAARIFVVARDRTPCAPRPAAVGNVSRETIWNWVGLRQTGGRSSSPAGRRALQARPQPECFT
jgi:hypothetical protein